MVNVIKATGERETFSEEKLRNSIKRAGIPHEIENQVAAHVISKLYENIPTSEIYNHIIEFLGTSSHPYSKSKYSLKQAIMALGPTGYPFEDFFAEVVKTQGYTTQTRLILNGKCVSHEIDVLAKKAENQIIVEAKFHNMPGTKTDIHVAMYTKARFDDIKDKNNISNVWLVTNTKATVDAISYCECTGVKIVSWSYPAADSLRDMIEKSRIMPITMLTTLSQSQKQTLLNQHKVLCKDIQSDPQTLNQLNLPDNKREEVLEEIKYLISNGSNFSDQSSQTISVNQ